ncbi:MAG: hypothetical protein ACOYXT_15520 [Bacteroidota bacterium]
MNRIVLSYFIVTSAIACKSQTCDLQGDWLIRHGRISKNYELAYPYATNRITFSSDSVELASGFFYGTENLDENLPEGRYPFVYYGNWEKYKLHHDSLSVFSRPYEMWNSFKIKCRSSDRVILLGKNDSLILERTDKLKMKDECSIIYIKAHIYGIGGDVDLFKINYKISLSKDDNLVFEEQKQGFKANSFKLKKGTFEKICEGFKKLNVKKLQKRYLAKLSHFDTIELEIGLEDGTVVRSELQGLNYPDELRLALIPVLYTHHQFLYSNLPPVK